MQMQFFIQIRIFFLVHGWVLNPSLRIAMHSQQLDWNKLFVGEWVGVENPSLRTAILGPTTR